MKIKLTLALMPLALAMTAQATLYSYDNISVNQQIPDGNPVGMTSSQLVSGIPDVAAPDGTVDQITDVNVNLNITGGYNGDLYGYLVYTDGSGNSTSAILLNRVGRSGAADFGYADSGFSVTLSDSVGAANIHSYQGGSYGLNGIGQLTNTWAADGITNNPQGSFSTTSGTQGLGVFNNLTANGTWTLFLADLAGGDTSTLVSWGVDISVVLEPITWALIIFGTGLAAVAIRRRLAA